MSLHDDTFFGVGDDAFFGVGDDAMLDNAAAVYVLVMWMNLVDRMGSVFSVTFCWHWEFVRMLVELVCGLCERSCRSWL